MESLLAVDVGLKTGLALYGQDGRLCWYRSKNYGSTTRLKRDAYNFLKTLPDLALLVLEGGGSLTTIWEREAERRGIPFRQINAERWRKKLLFPREQLTGFKAKQYAHDLACRTIVWSGLSPPKSLRTDSSEAILIGMWAVVEMGWLKNVPPELRQ